MTISGVWISGKQLFDPLGVSVFTTNPTDSRNTECLQYPGTGCSKMPDLALREQGVHREREHHAAKGEVVWSVSS